jgi:predicted nucleotidyltransferase
MTYHDLEIDPDEIAGLCRKYHICKLSLFGSVVRPDFGPTSAVDVIVEFEPGQVPGLEFFDIEAELSRRLGRRVDLNTPHSLSRYFADQVLAEAQVLYDAA